MSYHLSPPASQAGGGYSSVEPSDNESDSSLPDRDDEIDLLSANSHGQAGGHVLHHHRRRKSSVPEDPVVAAEGAGAGAGGVQHGIRHLKEMDESGQSLLPTESADAVEARRRLVPDTKWKLYDPQPFLSHILHPQLKTEDATLPANQHQHKPHSHHHHHHHHKQDAAMSKSAPSSRASSWFSQKSPVYDKTHYTFSPARENFEYFLHGGRSTSSNKPTATDSVSSLGSEEQESEDRRQSVGSESSGDESDDSDVSVRPRRLERRSSTFYEDATRRASETASALQTRAQEVTSAMDAIQSKIANFHLNVHSRASEEEEKSYGPSERATAEAEKSYGPRERGVTETAPKYAHFDDAHYSRDSLVRRRTRVGGSHSGKFEEEESVAEQKDEEREEEEEEEGYEFQSRKSVAAGPASVGEVKVLPREVEQDLLRRKSAEDEEAVVHAAAGASSSLGMSKAERRVSEWKPALGLEGRRTMSFDYNDYRKQFHGPLMTPEEEKRPGFSSRDAE